MIASAPNPWSLVSCSSLTPPCRKLPSFETPSLKNTLFFQLLASKLSSSWTAPELSQPERVPHSTQHDAHRLFNNSSSSSKIDTEIDPTLRRHVKWGGVGRVWFERGRKEMKQRGRTGPGWARDGIGGH